jgi:anti-sigma factor (TIGR02949 family)
MNPGGGTHQRDWDEQRETISTYVDGALPPTERTRFEQHVATCPDCQRELDAMRQVRALLRRMPQPALPRSFTLPAAPDSVPPAREPAPAAPTRARPDHVVPFPQRAGRVAQRIGTLAAAVGLVLLLGSALFGHPSGMSTSNTATSLPRAANGASGTTAAAGQAGPGYSSAQQTPREGTSGAQSTESKPATSPAPNNGGQFLSQPTPTPTPTPTRGSASTSPAVAAPTQGPPAVPLTGAGLLIGGAALAVAGRLISRRDRSTRAR